MASSSLTVECNRGVIRVFGGNRSCVREMHRSYETMSLEQFLYKHKFLNSDDYNSLKLTKRFNKR